MCHKSYKMMHENLFFLWKASFLFFAWFHNITSNHFITTHQEFWKWGYLPNVFTPHIPNKTRAVEELI